MKIGISNLRFQGWQRRKPLFVTAALVLLAMLLWLVLAEREPRYAGRSLSEWYALWAKYSEGEDPQSVAKAEEAAHAIREIGTNAIPILFRRLKFDVSLERNQFVILAYKLSPALAEKMVLHLSANKIEPTSTFVILGPRAAPAIPQLTALLYSTNDLQLSRTAAFCLIAIGPDALPTLLTALSNPKLPCCYDVAYWLGVDRILPLGTNISQAVPLLARCTICGDPRLAEAAIAAIGRIGLEPQISIHTLTNCLASTNSAVRRAAVRALAPFGKTAIPFLLDALQDSDQLVQYAAINSLRVIAPDTLTNVPAPFANPSQ
jgi:hypothetical protein